MKSSTIPIRVGLVGYGGLGHAHANSFARLRGARLTAVCDIRRKQLQVSEATTNLGKSGAAFDIRTARTYTDYRRLLDREELDAVLCILPTHLHAEFSIAALERGLHVFTEKPMALTERDCNRMIAARDRAQRHLMVGQCLRFWPEYEVLRKAVREQPYGPLRSLLMERIGSYSFWSYRDWMNDARLSGGAILDLHLHDVDWVLFALGKPQRLAASGLKGLSGGIDDVSALWAYSKSHVTLRGSWMHKEFFMGFRAFFEEASLDFNYGPSGATLWWKPRGRRPRAVRFKRQSAYFREVQYFIDCIRGRHPNTLCTAESTRDSVAMVALERQAIQTRRWIKP